MGARFLGALLVLGGGLVAPLSLAPVACGGFTGTSFDAAVGPRDDSGRRDPVGDPVDSALPSSSADAARPPLQSKPNPGGAEVSIACGELGDVCKLQGQTCCGGDTWEITSCDAGCAGPRRLACDDPADCPRGAVCCAKLSAVRREVESSSCNTAGTCAGEELALCARGDQCGSGHCTLARPQFLMACE